MGCQSCEGIIVFTVNSGMSQATPVNCFSARGFSWYTFYTAQPMAVLNWWCTRKGRKAKLGSNPFQFLSNSQALSLSLCVFMCTSLLVEKEHLDKLPNGRKQSNKGDMKFYKFHNLLPKRLYLSKDVGGQILAESEFIHSFKEMVRMIYIWFFYVTWSLSWSYSRRWYGVFPTNLKLDIGTKNKQRSVGQWAGIIDPYQCNFHLMFAKGTAQLAIYL